MFSNKIFIQNNSTRYKKHEPQHPKTRQKKIHKEKKTKNETIYKKNNKNLKKPTNYKVKIKLYTKYE